MRVCMCVCFDRIVCNYGCTNEYIISRHNRFPRPHLSLVFRMITFSYTSIDMTINT